MKLNKQIEKFDVFCKVLNKQFIEKLRAIFIINKTQLLTLQTVSPFGGIITGTLYQHNKTLKQLPIF